MLIMKYIPAIGIEVHAELKTQTKMFCDCKNDPDEKHPNHNICPICLAHPGTLPVPNEAALRAMVKIGLAVSGDIAQVTKFDRKNYFYPDLPKGYQISQYDMPIVRGGMFGNIELTRIHLEEDTGRLIHAADGKSSLVDYNRAGIPLMELVTEPHIATANEARVFAEELRLLLRYLNVSDADMEKGQMRIEVNVSVRLERQEALGTKVEVKNINSFKAAENAVRYEIDRQSKLLDAHKTVSQETRGWDDVKKITKSQRSKEDAHDYRYLPEPDIPYINIAEFNIETIRRELPELPSEKRMRLKEEYGLQDAQIELLVRERALAEFFEEAVSEIKASDKNKTVSMLFNYLSSDLVGVLTEQGMSIDETGLTPVHFADLVSLAADEAWPSRMTKDRLKEMIETRQNIQQVIKKSGGAQKISDEESEEIRGVMKKIIKNNPKVIDDYRKGKISAKKFLIGQLQKELKGRVDPEIFDELFDTAKTSFNKPEENSTETNSIERAIHSAIDNEISGSTNTESRASQEATEIDKNT